LVMNYPDPEHTGAPEREVKAHERSSGPFTISRVCSDILAVADAAGFERFIWWGFSWGGLIGLHLASRSDRVAALVCGGWPPLDGPYAEMLDAMRRLAVGSTNDRTTPPQPFVTFYESVQAWPEEQHVARLRCPRLAFVGTADDLEIAGVRLRLYARVHARSAELERLGWSVAEIENQDHSIYLHPEVIVPTVRDFLDARALA
jgi:pimeloyl-ACP methyl ester carboxylesterase